MLQLATVYTILLNKISATILRSTFSKTFRPVSKIIPGQNDIFDPVVPRRLLCQHSSEYAKGSRMPLVGKSLELQTSEVDQNLPIISAEVRPRTTGWAKT